MVWQVEMIWSERLRTFTDTIRIWDIVEAAAITSVVQLMNYRIESVDHKTTSFRSDLIRIPHQSTSDKSVV